MAVGRPAPFLVFSAFLGLFGLTVEAQSQSNYVFLDQPSHIRRIAMDLLGRPPAEADLATPQGSLNTLIDSYMTAPEFEKRILWLANDIFLTRTDSIEHFRDSYDYENESSRWGVAKSVGEEPLRLFAYIVMNDRPLTELVTADYTVADSTLAWFWNIDYPGDYYGSEWLRGRYRDGREHAGILSQSSFFYRYPTTISNKQRHRANHITKIFLDDDHLLRNVSVELRRGNADPNVDLLDATRHNPGCLACHSTLDGIGAHLFGWSIGPDGSSSYARELFGSFSQQGVERSQLQVLHQPSYYGYPSNGLADLGNYIAHDPRFARTMAKHIYKFFLHRNLDYRDRDLLNHLETVLIDSGYNTKALIREIVASDEYRAVGVAGGAKSVAEKVPAQPPKDLTQKWRDLEETIKASKIDSASKDEWLKAIRIHTIQTGYSMRNAEYQSSGAEKGTGGNPTAVYPPDPAEIVQPFKLATPEQLHSLGQYLVGEVWDGYEAGQWMPETFPHLEYNTDIKVAAGGYDGNLILERRWSVPPTYVLVVERWAEVLAEDILERELSESVPWSQRRVFTVATGHEDFYEAEPTVRNQIVDWFRRFYGQTVDANSPEVNDVFGVLLLAREAAREEFGDWYSLEVAWSHVLGMLLTDPRIALY